MHTFTSSSSPGRCDLIATTDRICECGRNFTDVPSRLRVVVVVFKRCAARTMPKKPFRKSRIAAPESPFSPRVEPSQQTPVILQICQIYNSNKFTLVLADNSSVCYWFSFCVDSKHDIILP